MSAEEATERLAEHLDVWGVFTAGDGGRIIRARTSTELAAAALDWFANEASADDLAVLLAGRPVEERAQAAGFKGGPDFWVAIPEEET